jgi:tetratricopeptide (TPR) repeat protein
MISFDQKAGPLAAPASAIDYSRFEGIGDDDDDDGKASPARKAEMDQRMKGVQSMIDMMTKGKRQPAATTVPPTTKPARTLKQLIPAHLHPQLRALTPDGGCMLRSLSGGGGEGEENGDGERPRERAKCNFEWKAEYVSPRGPVDSTQEDWRECPGGGVRLGKQFKLRGWELALAAMRVGEVAEVYCAPRYAEGLSDIQMTLLRLEHAAGCPGGTARLSGCPACNPELTAKQVEFQNSGQLARRGEALIFTIRFTSVEQFDVRAAEYWELDVESRIAAAGQWRLEGNERFGRRDYRGAVELYHKAVSYLETMLDQVTGPASDESEESAATAARLKLLKLPLHLNRALGLLKLEDYIGAGRSCEKVLEDDPDNVKALFRLGQAFVGLHEYGPAERHFARAESCARQAGNAAAAGNAQKEADKMRRVMARSKQRDKKLAAKMFEGLGDKNKGAMQKEEEQGDGGEVGVGTASSSREQNTCVGADAEASCAGCGAVDNDGEPGGDDTASVQDAQKEAKELVEQQDDGHDMDEEEARVSAAEAAAAATRAGVLQRAQAEAERRVAEAEAARIEAERERDRWRAAAEEVRAAAAGAAMVASQRGAGTVHAVFTEQGSLGLNFVPSTEDGCGDGAAGATGGGSARVRVRRVKPGSQATAHPQLRAGLLLASVGGTSVCDVSYGEVIQMIQTTKQRPLTLGFDTVDTDVAPEMPPTEDGESEVQAPAKGDATAAPLLVPPPCSPRAHPELGKDADAVSVDGDADDARAGLLREYGLDNASAAAVNAAREQATAESRDYPSSSVTARREDEEALAAALRKVAEAVQLEKEQTEAEAEANAAGRPWSRMNSQVVGVAVMLVGLVLGMQSGQSDGMQPRSWMAWGVAGVFTLGCGLATVVFVAMRFRLQEARANVSTATL